MLAQIPFEDGQPPPKEAIAKWHAVVMKASDDGGRVAIHCVAGLGRAPVMVAIALIDAARPLISIFCLSLSLFFYIHFKNQSIQ